jgi:hypothetical protein
MPAAPLFVWTVWLRVVGEGITPATAQDVRERLRRYDATTLVDDGELNIRVRIVGHVGPASAVGDAQQATLFEVARAGIRGSRVDVVHARRLSATEVGRHR